MAIFKAKVSSEYTIIPNNLLRDERLSFETKGLLCLLLSLPEDWKVSKEWIIKQSSAGRDKVTRMLSELQNTNYINKVTTHDKEGKITGVDWLVYPYDTVNKLLSTAERESRPTANPDDGKSATTKERVLQSKDNTNSHPVGFDVFWASYPRKVKKPAAEKAYKAAIKKMECSEGFAEFAANDCKLRFANTETKFIPHATTYLNNFMWEDELCN